MKKVLKLTNYVFEYVTSNIVSMYDARTYGTPANPLLMMNKRDINCLLYQLTENEDYNMEDLDNIHLKIECIRWTYWIQIITNTRSTTFHLMEGGVITNSFFLERDQVIELVEFLDYISFNVKNAQPPSNENISLVYGNPEKQSNVLSIHFLRKRIHLNTEVAQILLNFISDGPRNNYLSIQNFYFEMKKDCFVIEVDDILTNYRVEYKPAQIDMIVESLVKYISFMLDGKYE